MLTVEEALDAVLNRAAPLPPRRFSLREVTGCILAEDVVADLDSPPFRKALVDGYAIRAADFATETTPFRVVEEVPAGRMPTLPIGPGEATLIMTGAPMPDGADTVVMREQSRSGPDGLVTFATAKPIAAGQNWMPRGREMLAGEVVLRPGRLLGSAQVGLLASVGRAQVAVHPRPRVIVVPTGDELVEPECLPGPGRIRNSNAALLRGFALGCGAIAEASPIAPDEPEALREALRLGLDAADVLLVAGGVSAGDRDLVPATLKSLGVAEVFHKVLLKPGKPLWFGVGEGRGTSPGPLVFGLPGNPVGAAVCALLFVRPALASLRGDAAIRPAPEPATLSRPFTQRGPRPTYHPARRTAQPGGTRPEVEPLDWAGSADLRTLAGADGFAIFPAGDYTYGRGQVVDFLAMP